MLTGCCAPFHGAQGKQELRGKAAGSRLAQNSWPWGLAVVFSGYPAVTEVGFMHG